MFHYRDLSSRLNIYMEPPCHVDLGVDRKKIPYIPVYLPADFSFARVTFS